MAKVASATVFLNANLGALSKGLADAERATKHSVGNIVGSLHKIGQGMTIAGGIITAGLTKLVVDFASYGDEINKAAGRTGLTTEAISELKYAADQSGASLEGVEKGLLKMNRFLVEARDEAADAGSKLSGDFAKALSDTQKKVSKLNGDYAIAVQRYREMQANGKALPSQLMEQKRKVDDLSKALTESTATLDAMNNSSGDGVAAVGEYGQQLAKLGFSVQDLEGLNSDQIFMKLGDAISKVPDEVERTALMMEIFGKSGAQLLPLFQQGASGVEELRKKAVELGLVIDQDTANKATLLGDTWQDAMESAKVLGMEIAVALVPSIQSAVNWVNEVAAKFKAWREENPGAVESIAKVTAVIGGVLVVGGPLLIFLGSTIAAISTLFGAFGVTGPAVAAFGGTLGGVGALFAAGGAAAALVLGLAAIGETLYKLATGAPEASNFISRFFDKILSYVPGLKELKDLYFDLVYKITNFPADAWNKLFGPDSPALGAGINAAGAAAAQDKTPAYAGGTDFHRGGLAWVGERGPELVNLPRGSQVRSNRESMAMARGNGGITINGGVNLTTSADDNPRAMLDRFNAMLKLKDAQAGA